jgi:RecJ-like exonuclease
MSFFETITAAMNEPDLSDAVAHIQRACGITDKANAYRWFDCIADAQWENNLSGARLGLLMDYLAHEYTFKEWEQDQ